MTSAMSLETGERAMLLEDLFDGVEKAAVTNDWAVRSRWRIYRSLDEKIFPTSRTFSDRRLK